MAVVLDREGNIQAAGPLLRKIRAKTPLIGQSFFAVFTIYRPAGVSEMAHLAGAEPAILRLRFLVEPQTSFKAQWVPLGDGGGIVNLSFGISVAEAVAEYRLTLADFAPTDLTVEMLYLMEAKTAAMSASRELNTRLQGARIAAEERAYTDTLTGLKNRRALEHVMGRMIATREPFGLMQIDLDYFKAVNDTRGHAAGDHILQCVARHMVNLTRSDDLVARVGGDEFVIVLRGAIDLNILTDIAKRLITKIEEPVMYEGGPCQVSASIGITVSSLYKTPTAAEMMKHSDMALYTSKRRGRAQHTVYSDALAS